MLVTDINQLDLSGNYTYKDYLNWKFDDMVELIKGKIFKMAPAPSAKHQRISRDLMLYIGNYLKNKNCEEFAAPFDVRLPLPPHQRSADKIDTVVQPDISIICDLSKIDEKGCHGAPDWIIEILSKSTAQKDFKEKFEIYQHAGVKEYWIIHPSEQTVAPYILNEDGEYVLIRQKLYVKGETIPVHTFPDFEIPLDEVFTSTDLF